jgi:hypothetical protein
MRKKSILIALCSLAISAHKRVRASRGQKFLATACCVCLRARFSQELVAMEYFNRRAKAGVWLHGGSRGAPTRADGAPAVRDGLRSDGFDVLRLSRESLNFDGPGIAIVSFDQDVANRGRSSTLLKVG